MVRAFHVVTRRSRTCLRRPTLAALRFLAAFYTGQEEKLVGAAGDPDACAIRNLARQNLVGERILHLALDDPLQRPRAVNRIVALLGKPDPRRLVEIEPDLAILEQLRE